jgi:hypothetical protein
MKENILNKTVLTIIVACISFLSACEYLEFNEEERHELDPGGGGDNGEDNVGTYDPSMPPTWDYQLIYEYDGGNMEEPIRESNVCLEYNGGNIPVVSFVYTDMMAIPTLEYSWPAGPGNPWNTTSIGANGVTTFQSMDFSFDDNIIYLIGGAFSGPPTKITIQPDFNNTTALLDTLTPAATRGVTAISIDASAGTPFFFLYQSANELYSTSDTNSPYGFGANARFVQTLETLTNSPRILSMDAAHDNNGNVHAVYLYEYDNGTIMRVLQYAEFDGAA